MRKHFSVIILTYNGEETIGNLLKELMKYKDYIIEIVIIDSNSSDNTIHIVQKYYKSGLINLHKLGKKQFNHGTTRNMAVKISKGKYCIFISQDAIPINNFSPYIVEDFNYDERVIAVFGKQIPRNSSPVIQRIEYLCRFDELDHYTKNGVLMFDREKPVIPFNERNSLIWYSLFNTFACYKKSYLLKNPFNTTMYGEDLLMGKKIIEDGFIKIYDNRCKVVHSHSLHLFEYFKSQITDFNLKTGKLNSRPGIKLNLKIKKIIQERLPIYKKFYYLFELVIYYFVKLLAYFYVLVRRIFLDS